MKRSRVIAPGQAALGAFLLEFCVASTLLVWNHAIPHGGGPEAFARTLIDIYIGVGVLLWSLVFGVTAGIQRARYRDIFGVHTHKAALAVRLHGAMVVASLAWLGNAGWFLHD